MRFVWLVALGALFACERDGQRTDVPGEPGATKTAAHERAERRMYDGAPPVIPHKPLGRNCTTCHDEDGMSVPALGFAPQMPHDLRDGRFLHCNQCHVFQQTKNTFVASTFVGLPQDLRSGDRMYEGAPPTMPHRSFMRENCRACHTGPAAREPIRTDHPERLNCRQCHVQERAQEDSFVRSP